MSDARARRDDDPDVERGVRDDAETSTREDARDADDGRRRDGRRAGDDATSARDDGDDDDDARAPIGGINDDGYFGDADGAWLSSDRVPLVLRAQEASLAAGQDYRRDARAFLDTFGWPIAAAAFCVALLLFAMWACFGGGAKPRGKP